jgi:L-rhamnose-H+ transport protein
MGGRMIVAIFWLIAAGIVQGAFPLPMKYTRKWAFEHLWFWYSAVAFFVLPVLMAVSTVPDLHNVMRAATGRALFAIVAFGATWGCGSVLFGLGIDALGMTLGFPIMTGLTTALGALIPMAILTPGLLLARNGILTIAGNLVTIAGVFISAKAGEQRDRQLGRTETESMLGPRRTFATALTICIASGVLSAMFNFGYAFGTPLTQTAIQFGATADNATNAVWLVMLPAGGIMNLAYCLHLGRRNRTGPRFLRGTARDWISAISMAAMWTGSVVLYGWGANGLGKLGPTVGWSLWNAILITTTVLCGLATGEWRGAHRTPVRMLWASVAVLIAGMFILGAGV